MKKIYAILLAIFLLTGVCPIPLYAATTVAVSANAENDADIFDLTDGEYAIDVAMTGGSGKATIQSPTLLTLNDGIAYVSITWSSSNYDYMIVDGQKYLKVKKMPILTSRFRLLILLRMFPSLLTHWPWEHLTKSRMCLPLTLLPLHQKAPSRRKVPNVC